MGCCGIGSSGGLFGTGLLSGGSGSNTNVDASNRVNLTNTNEIDITIDNDALALAIDRQAEASEDGNKWHELNAKAEILETVNEIKSDHAQLQLAKASYAEQKRNNKIMLGIAVIGLFLTFKKVKK